MTTDPLFTPAEPPARRDGPPPPVKCGYPLDLKPIPRRCQRRGPHSVLMGRRQDGVIRNGVCKEHLPELLNGLAEAGMNYELL